MNKTEYLEWLRKWNACKPALKWVESRPEDFARDILLACDRIDWLCWNIGRMNPTKIAEFAKRCADRATAEWAARARAWLEAARAAKAKVANTEWAATAAAERLATATAEWAEEAARWAAQREAEEAAWAAEWAEEAARWAAQREAEEAAWAARWAAERASGAARTADAERQAQLEDLHALVKEVF